MQEISLREAETKDLKEVIKLFKDAINMNNVILPKEFVDVILKL